MSEDNRNGDKLAAKGEPKFSTVGKWLENFWYHYKAQTLIAAVLIITLVVSMIQILRRDTYDYVLLYAGPTGLAVQDVVYIENAVEELGADCNGDGEIQATLSDILMLSDEEIIAAKADGVMLSPDFVRSSRIEYSQQIIGGDAVICFLSPYVHGMLVDAGGLMKMTDIFEAPPKGAYGDYGILLSETEFGQYFNGVNDLAKDTVLCIRTVSTMAKFKGEEKTVAAHDSNVELFKKIVEFKAPEVESVFETEKLVEN